MATGKGTAVSPFPIPPTQHQIVYPESYPILRGYRAFLVTAVFSHDQPVVVQEDTAVSPPISLEKNGQTAKQIKQEIRFPSSSIYVVASALLTGINYEDWSPPTWERNVIMSLQPDGDRATIKRFRRLPIMLGKIAALLILAIALVLGPMGMISLNKAWGWPRWQIPLCQVIGGGLMIGAAAVWLHCSHLFSRIGKGTFFATEPPRRLVAAGLYRYSRNPFYVAHVAFLFGWFLLSGCPTILLYTGLAVALIQAVIIWWEEPGLRERFGKEYERYTQTVPRWLFIRSRRS